MKETEDGEAQLIEVNARLGSGKIFTTLAGANLRAFILNLIEGKEITLQKISEVTVTLYVEEIGGNDSLLLQINPIPILRIGKL